MYKLILWGGILGFILFGETLGFLAKRYVKLVSLRRMLFFMIVSTCLICVLWWVMLNCACGCIEPQFYIFMECLFW